MPFKISSLVLLAFGSAVTVYLFGFVEAQESLFEWCAVLVALIPFGLLACAAWWVSNKNLQAVVLLVAALCGLLSSACIWSMFAPQPPGEDTEPILILFVIWPPEILLSLWVFGAVLQDRWRSRPKPKS